MLDKTGQVTERASTVARRQAILDSALRLFATRGLQATSVEDICVASGASNGSLYHHFGSKEGIAATLYAGAIADYQQGALATFKEASSAEAGFRGCVKHYLMWVRDHQELAILMLAVEHSDLRELASDELAALNDTFRIQISEWMGSRAAAGDLPDIPRGLVVPAMLGPPRRFAELWLQGKTDTSIDDAARVLADVVWRGLNARTPQATKKDGHARRPTLQERARRTR